MLTGELPFDAETPIGIAMKHMSGELRPPKELNPEVPEQLDGMTVRLLAREPEERYPNAGALIEDLQQKSKGFAIGVGRIPEDSAAAPRVETTPQTEERTKEIRFVVHAQFIRDSSPSALIRWSSGHAEREKSAET